MTPSPEDRMPDRAPAPEEVVGLLADRLRRRMVGLLDGTPRSRAEVIEVTQAPARKVIEQLGRLESAGVVRAEGDRYHLVEDVFARSVREAAGQRLGPLNDQHAQVARRYFFRNRLLQVPSEPWALKVVLDLVAEDFQPGEVYDEREVNTTLYGWNGDWAALRRLLVDHGHLRREKGRYWRVAVGDEVSQ